MTDQDQESTKNKHDAKHQVDRLLCGGHPTMEQLDNACLARRHDFGLMERLGQSELRGEAREWLKCWLKAIAT